MTEFGLALVIGGLGFAVSMIPVVAYTLNFGCRKARPAAPTDKQYLFTTNRFRNCFIRDMSFAMISLTLFFFALKTGTIDVKQICFQLCVFIAYCIVVWYQDAES